MGDILLLRDMKTDYMKAWACQIQHDIIKTAINHKTPTHEGMETLTCEQMDALRHQDMGDQKTYTHEHMKE